MTTRIPMPVRIPLRLAVLAPLLLALVAPGCSPVESTDLPGGTDLPGTDNPGTDNPGTDNPGTDNPAVTFQALYDGYFQLCRDCHTPGGIGRTSDTETTLDFSTVQTAKNTLKSGTASGMSGNVEACNGVPFIGATYQQSLVVATIDETVRASFSATGQGPCDQAAVTDMTLKVADQAPPSAAFLKDLKDWIDAGAP